MPELPEVETLADELRNSELIGSKIIGLEIFWGKTIAKISPEEFRNKIVGQKIVSVSRRAKNLIIALSNKLHIVIHLRMTGRLQLADSEQNSRNKHEHLIVKLSDHKELRFHDTRKFGRWFLVEDLEEFFKFIGPEPFGSEFLLPTFSAKLKKKSRQLKPTLLDQSFLAGLGNIYVDEALWEAKLHPQTICKVLNDQQIKMLFKVIPIVLKRGIESKGTTLGKGKTNFYGLSGKRGNNKEQLKVFRRTGKPCPRCGETIIRIIVGQRSSHICPKCQRIS